MTYVWHDWYVTLCSKLKNHICGALMVSKLTTQKLRRENLYFLAVYKVALLIFLLFYAILIENK